MSDDIKFSIKIDSRGYWVGDRNNEPHEKASEEKMWNDNSSYKNIEGLRWGGFKVSFSSESSLQSEIEFSTLALNIHLTSRAPLLHMHESPPAQVEVGKEETLAPESSVIFQIHLQFQIKMWEIRDLYEYQISM